MSEITIEGRRFSWTSSGSGPLLLLVNGYAATGADWDPDFLAALSESFEVICPDNRGMGRSELGTAELTVDAMAADLEALLDALDPKAAAVPVVGWSMGGFLAQRLAERSPARVSALALIASDPGAPDCIAAAPEFWGRLVDHSGTPREQATRLISLLFPPDLAPEIDHRFGELVAAARAEISEPALSAQEAAMEQWHRVRRSPVALAPGTPAPPPTLVLHGDEDRVIPVANAEALAARWPGARIEIVPGTAHAVMAQEPQRVAAAIGAFVSA